MALAALSLDFWQTLYHHTGTTEYRRQVRTRLLANYLLEQGVADATSFAASYFDVVDTYIKQRWRQGLCTPREDIIEHAYAHYGSGFSREALGRLLDYLRQIYATVLPPILVDGARDFLYWARLRWPLYVISDTYTLDGETLNRILANDGILSLFRRTYYSDQLGVEKPNPRAVHEICRTQAITPNELIHVGDLPKRDGMLARNAGCRFVLFGSSELPVALEEDGVVMQRASFDGLKGVLDSIG